MTFTRSLGAALLLNLVLIAGGASTAQAQRFNLGADFVSRYVWRGFDFGESFSVQPTLEFSAGNFTIGSWASYSISKDGADANEHDLYASFSFGPVSLGVTDYHFPAPGGLPLFEEDAHYLELNGSAGGTEEFPLSISANIFVTTDDDNSIYLEFGYPFTVEEVDLGVAIGIVPQESAFYGTNSFGVVNMSLSASKEIPITDNFSLPIFVSYIVNPTPGAERSFLVVGLSL